MRKPLVYFANSEYSSDTYSNSDHKNWQHTNLLAYYRLLHALKRQQENSNDHKFFLNYRIQ